MGQLRLEPVTHRLTVVTLTYMGSYTFLYFLYQNDKDELDKDESLAQRLERKLANQRLELTSSGEPSSDMVDTSEHVTLDQTECTATR